MARRTKAKQTRLQLAEARRGAHVAEARVTAAKERVGMGSEGAFRGDQDAAGARLQAEQQDLERARRLVDELSARQKELEEAAAARGRRRGPRGDAERRLALACTALRFLDGRAAVLLGLLVGVASGWLCYRRATASVFLAAFTGGLLFIVTVVGSHRLVLGRARRALALLRASLRDLPFAVEGFEPLLRAEPIKSQVMLRVRFLEAPDREQVLASLHEVLDAQARASARWREDGVSLRLEAPAGWVSSARWRRPILRILRALVDLHERAPISMVGMDGA